MTPAMTDDLDALKRHITELRRQISTHVDQSVRAQQRGDHEEVRQHQQAGAALERQLREAELTLNIAEMPPDLRAWTERQCRTIASRWPLLTADKIVQWISDTEVVADQHWSQREVLIGYARRFMAAEGLGSDAKPSARTPGGGPAGSAGRQASEAIVKALTSVGHAHSFTETERATLAAASQALDAGDHAAAARQLTAFRTALTDRDAPAWIQDWAAWLLRHTGEDRDTDEGARTVKAAAEPTGPQNPVRPTGSAETPSGESTTLTAALQFTSAMADRSTTAVSEVELSIAELRSGGVGGPALDALAQALQALQQAADAFAAAHGELSGHLQVRDAYSAHAGAGSREFVTPD